MSRAGRLLPKDSPVRAFLNSRDPGHGAFITHLDKTPRNVKMAVFAIPLVFNLVCSVLLAWRFHHLASAPDSPLVLALYYFDHRPHLTLPKTVSEVPWVFAARVLFHIVFDLILYHRIWPLVLDFATGHFYYRLMTGFRFAEEEAVFRAPVGQLRSLTVDAPGLSEQERAKRWMASVVEATNERMLEANSGPNTRSGFWLVDYHTMVAAHAAARKGEIELKTWETGVWSREGETWDHWEVGKTKAQQIDFAKVLEKLGPKLRDLDKPDLFGEFVQYMIKENESNSTTPEERNQAAMEMFKKEGLDYLQIIGEIVRDIQSEEVEDDS